MTCYRRCMDAFNGLFGHARGNLRGWLGDNEAQVRAAIDSVLKPRSAAVPQGVTRGRSTKGVAYRWVVANGRVFVQLDDGPVVNGRVDYFAPFKAVDPGKTRWRFFRHPETDEWWAEIRDVSVLFGIGADPSPVVAAGGGGGAQAETGVSFDLLPSGYVRLFLPRRWTPPAPVAGIVVLRKDAGDARWYWLFKASRAAKLVAPALSREYPETAARLAAAFAKDAEPHDGDFACDPLRDMAGAPTPEDVKHPIGRAVLADVSAALRVRLPVGMKPYPYQTVGVAFAKMTGYRCIIGDEMGLGKTPQSLMALAVDPVETLPALVVCPAIVFTNWQKEIGMWLPAVPIWKLAKRSDPLPPKGFKGIILTKYSVVADHADALRAFSPRTLIADEAHRIKNPAAQQTIAVTSIAERVAHVILLSGTPIKNNVPELWNLLNTVNPEDYGRKADYDDEYVVFEEKRIGARVVREPVGGKNVEQLRERLKCMMIRRFKEDVAKWLPPKRRVVVTLEGETRAMAEYQRAKTRFPAWLDGMLHKRHPDATDSDIRQMVARTMRAEAAARVAYLRELAGLAKVDEALEVVSTFVEADAPVVLFAVNKSVVSALSDAMTQAGIHHGVIDGGTSADERGRLVSAFQRGDFPVMLGSDAMTEGVTLTRASDVVFVQRAWTPADEEQREDRCHRIGSERPVTVHFLEIPGTVDEAIRKVIEGKRGLVRDVVGTADVEQSATDVAAALAEIEGSAGGGKKQRGRKKNGAPRDDKPTRSALRRGDVRTVIFDKRLWSKHAAKQWLAVNKFGSRLEDSGGRYMHRTDALQYGRGRAVKVADGVSALVNS